MIYTREDIELISKILYSGILQDNNKSIGNIFEFVKEIEFKCNESCDSDTEKYLGILLNVETLQL